MRCDLTLRSGIQFVVVVFLTGIIAGCSFFNTPKTITPSSTLTWDQRQAALTRVTAWQVKGAIGLQDAKQVQSASLQWQQSSVNTFAIRLFGPLGAGNTIIIGRPGQVTLTTSDKKTITATDGETLLRQQTGWQLPIDNIYYWARGLPAPGDSPRVQLDSASRLQSLQQAGWRIDYQRYSPVNGLELPGKIILTNGRMTIRLIINQWSFSNKTY